jgi:galactokinase
VAIVKADAADDFVAATSAAYKARTGHDPAVYVCRATDGAAVV